MSGLIDYLKKSREELAKVTWPTRQTTVNHTVMVIAVSLAVAIFLGAVDYLLNIILEILI